MALTGWRTRTMVTTLRGLDAGRVVPAMLTKRFSPGDRLSSATAASNGRSIGIVRRQAGGFPSFEIRHPRWRDHFYPFENDGAERRASWRAAIAGRRAH